MTDDKELNRLETKTIDEPIVFSLRKLAQKEDKYPIFGEYFGEARKLLAGERRMQNRRSKRIYFWREDSEYVISELVKLYCWAALSSRTIDKSKIEVWSPHYGSTAKDFKNAIEMAKGGILLVEETENFFLSLNEFLGLESSTEEKQTAEKEGWKIIAEGLGLEPEGRIILPEQTLVIVIVKPRMARTLGRCINTTEILEQKRLRYPLKQCCTVWQTLSRTTRCHGRGGDGLDASVEAVLIGDTIYAIDAEGETIPYSRNAGSPFDAPESPQGLIAMDLYSEISQFCNQGKWGYVDIYTGKIKVPAEFDYVGALCSKNHDWREPIAYAFAKKNGLAGIINQYGEAIIPLVWDDLHWKNDDCAAPEGPIFVKRNRLWGAVDMTGKVLAPVQWRRMSDVWLYLDGRKPCSWRQRRQKRKQIKEEWERRIKSLFRFDDIGEE